MPLFDPAAPKFNRFDMFFSRYCPPNGVPVLLAKAICLNESDMGDDPLVQSGQLSVDGLSKGIMQLTLATANDWEDVTLDDLNDPKTSIRIACLQLGRILRSFDVVDARYIEWCVKSYNRGITRTKQERDGDPRGFAEPSFSRGQEYWARYQRNYSALGGIL